MSYDPEWTPGPWHWNEDRMRDGWTGLFGADETPVIYPQRENDGDDGAAWFAKEEDAGEEGLSDADRSLIEAAPELYAALRESSKQLRAAGYGGMAAVAESALAKARGESKQEDEA